ncbi:MAG: CHASE2 domain-containing protein [Alphaproteobacteria bacterium]|nr:CHASE2 domain-containing protein [Alphaproteobacteria bacterium]
MRRFLLTTFVSAAAVLAIVALRLWNPTPVEMLGQRVFDFYQVLAPRPSADSPVVVVEIDEESLAVHGQWPWPRTLIADLIQRLQQGGVAAAALNILFAEPDRASPAALAESFRGLDAAMVAELRRLPTNDTILAQAIAGGRVVLGQTTTPVAGPGAAAADGKRSSFVEVGDNPRRFLFAFPGLSRNLRELEQAAAGIGLTTLVPEADGVLCAGCTCWHGSAMISIPRSRSRRCVPPRGRRWSRCGAMPSGSKPWPCPALPFRPTVTAASGCATACRRRSARSRPATCWPAASAPIGCRAASRCSG